MTNQVVCSSRRYCCQYVYVVCRQTECRAWNFMCATTFGFRFTCLPDFLELFHIGLGFQYGNLLDFWSRCFSFTNLMLSCCQPDCQMCLHSELEMCSPIDAQQHILLATCKHSLLHNNMSLTFDLLTSHS